MDFNDARKHWYANIYDTTFTNTDDIDFLLGIIGEKSKNILEVCCGTGRILVPLARANHIVTGLDMDEYMMERIKEKSIGLKNIEYFKADAINNDWGSNYDIVVFACNIFMNIITENVNERPQKIFIEKAAKSLKSGGYVYIEFSINKDFEESYVKKDPDWTIFEGTDDRDVFGKFIMCGEGSFDKETQMNYGKRKIELKFPNGDTDLYEYEFNKSIPRLDEVEKWLKENNFVIEEKYGNFKKEPITQNSDRVIIYARKM